MPTTADQLKQSRAFLCLECGKCTAVCPVSQANGSYSPRRLLAEGLFYGPDELISDRLLWSCLTCQLCSKRCPVDVKYSDYMRDVRAEAHSRGKSGVATHSGALHEIMEMSASPSLKQERMGWVEDGLKVQEKGDVLYFVGCLPYYETIFGKEFAFSPLDIARDTVRILNHLGIQPAVMANERCCGHDLYWLGRTERFDEIGRLNLAQIGETGAKTVVTACAECALTLKQLYPQRLGASPFEVKHISELVAENLERLHFKAHPGSITYQDPCRLGRHLGVYEPPRQALAAIPGLESSEMMHSRAGAICCGTAHWTNCDAFSKQIQRRRLKEAAQTGAETLVTACPKCQIHFRCAGCGDDPEKAEIRLTDFVNVVASALQNGDAE